MSKSVTGIRGFGLGIVRRGDSADLPKNSLWSGENIRLDLTGDPTCRPGSGVVSVPGMPDPAFGPWEYEDAEGYTACIIADSTGGIYEIGAAATKIGQFPSTAAQRVRSHEKSEFGRLTFTNEIDRPHILHRVGGAWDFRPSGLTDVPAAPTANTVSGNAFSTPGINRFRLAYRYQSGASFVLGGSYPDQIDKRFNGTEWETIAGGPAGDAQGYIFGGPISWYNSPNQLITSGLAFACGIQSDAILGGAVPPPAPTWPIPLDNYSRRLRIYNWDGGFSPEYTLFDPTRSPNEYCCWMPASALFAPRSWGGARLFAYILRDWYATRRLSNPPQWDNNVAVELVEITSIDPALGRANIQPLYSNIVRTTSNYGQDPVQPSAADFKAGYYNLYASLICSTDNPDQLWVLEQDGEEYTPPGWRSDVRPKTGVNARLVFYTLNGASTTREVVSADVGFQITSRNSALLYRFGSSDGKLHYYEDGGVKIRTFDTVLRSWSETSGAQRFGPFASSTPDTGYAWYFDAAGSDGKLVRELMPGAEAPDGTGTFMIVVTYKDNLGAESAPSEPVEITTELNSDIRLTNISTGPAYISKRLIYSTLSNGTTFYFLAEIDDNSTEESTISADDTARNTKIEAPDSVTRGIAPAGVALVIPMPGRMVYTSATTNQYWWSSPDEPDNFPPENTQLLGADRRPIRAIDEFGDLIILQKESQTYVTAAIDDAPVLRLPAIGIRHPSSAIVDERLGRLFVGGDGVYAFDGYVAKRVSDQLDAQFLAALLGAPDSFAFRHDTLIHWICGDVGYVFDAAGRWISRDVYPFSVTGCRYVGGAYAAGEGTLVAGIWALGGGVMRRFGNETKTDGAEWDGSAYTVGGTAIEWEIETQEAVIASGREVNAYCLGVDCEVVS